MCPGDGRRPRRELAFYFPVTAGAAPQRGASDVNNPDGVEVTGPAGPRYDEILTPEALSLIAALQRELGPRRGGGPRRPRDARRRAPRARGRPPSARRPRSGRTAPGGWPSRPPAWSTGGSRSPARPTRRRTSKPSNRGAKGGGGDPG